MMDSEDFLFAAFLIFVFGVVCGVFGVIIWSDDINPDKLISIRKMDYHNVRYVLSIDSSATDSLYGKTWRK